MELVKTEKFWNYKILVYSYLDNMGGTKYSYEVFHTKLSGIIDRCKGFNDIAKAIIYAKDDIDIVDRIFCQ